jgi:hypothetical protein
VVLEKDEDYFNQSFKYEEVIHKINKEMNTLLKVNGRVTGLVIFCVGTAL